MIDRLGVYLDDDTGAPRLVADTFFTARRGLLASSTVRYDTSYLADPSAFAIDPALTLSSGPQNVPGLPGALQDCSPDRWGRNLIVKQRRAIAFADHVVPPTLTDVDFLVGVSDRTRQGALRVRTPDGEEFLAPGSEVPKLIELPHLLHAADTVGRDDDFGAVKALLDAGSGSLGGARPKASIRDDDRLLIAKFPHPDDEWDVMAWEKTALDLASAAGIRVPRARLVQVDRRSVLLVERFDREAQRRVPYVSAMTLLEARDGDTHDYVEIAEAMADVSAGASADLNELWRRIAFSVLINNTDDHLRNHGFLHRRGGWQLSPAFDLNPNPDVRASRQTPIAGVETRAGAIDALMAYADAFRVDPPATAEILKRVSDAVSGWREIAAGNGIRARELDLFEPALTF